MKIWKRIISALLLMTFVISAGCSNKESSDEKYDAYLMAYFTGAKESIYFAYSEDGISWRSLNNGKSVLDSNIGTKGARDPFLLRSNDGSKFYILATDLAINISKDWWAAQSAGSKNIVIWESEDLVNWTKPRLAKVGTDTSGCVWAPEATYLPEIGKYAVYWASRTSNDNYSKQRIWYSLTEDFITFSDPKIWIDLSHDVIDTTVIYSEGYYYRFSKYEGKSCVILEKSKDFFGEWESVSSPSLISQSGVEGPFCYSLLPKDKTEEANYVLLLDNYGGSGYYIMNALSLDEAVFTKKKGYSMADPKPRHGSVIWITKEELIGVKEKWLNIIK